MMKKIVIHGATGTIGVNTLDVISRYPEKYQLIGVSAHSNWQRMLELCQKYSPQQVVMVEPQAAEQLDKALQKAGLEIQVSAGKAQLEMLSALDEVDYVMAAIVGAAGLLPTLAAAKKGKRILLANKEALVMSGPIFMQTVKDNGASVLPIDSEHNALFQCMPDQKQSLAAMGIRKLHLTASGGPFLKRDLDSLHSVTPEEAVAHPNWVMGRKISVDSATMMNKGLEYIEACYLFDASPQQVAIVIHPQSMIHSMVEYLDGSFLAQLGQADMRIPIAHALAWPQRIQSGADSLQLQQLGSLDFMPLDRDRFPCVRLAQEAFAQGGTSTTILNAANEVAVEAFLHNAIKFTQIAPLIEAILEQISPNYDLDLDSILAHDLQAREQAQLWIKNSA